MKLELEFATGDDLINFLACVTEPARSKYLKLDKASPINALPTDVTPRLAAAGSATVTPEKQDKARQSTGKVKDFADLTSEQKANVNTKIDAANAEKAATPESVLVDALTYEKDLGVVFARAVVANKAAALAVVVANGGGTADKPEASKIPKAAWPEVMTALQAVIDAPADAAPEPLDYERDVMPKVKAAQAKDKAALVAALTAHGGVDPETKKPSGRFVPADKLSDLVVALDTIVGA